MFFTEDYNLRKYEYLMRGVPNFKPRGHGMIVVCGLRYIPMYESRKQLILWATQNIRHPAFRKRLNNYLIERGEYVMDFVNNRHREAFEESIRKVNRGNRKLLAAIYLLTANFALQRTAQLHIRNNDIMFRNIHTRYLDVEGYTLLCAAKDIFLGTRYLCISDLSDSIIISSDVFALMCNALSIKRFGLMAIKNEGEN